MALYVTFRRFFCPASLHCFVSLGIVMIRPQGALTWSFFLGTNPLLSSHYVLQYLVVLVALSVPVINIITCGLFLKYL